MPTSPRRHQKTLHHKHRAVKGKERKSIYIAPFRLRIVSKRSNMDYAVLPANYTMPAFHESSRHYQHTADPAATRNVSYTHCVPMVNLRHLSSPLSSCHKHFPTVNLQHLSSLLSSCHKHFPMVNLQHLSSPVSSCNKHFLFAQPMTLDHWWQASPVKYITSKLTYL